MAELSQAIPCLLTCYCSWGGGMATSPPVSPPHQRFWGRWDVAVGAFCLCHELHCAPSSPLLETFLPAVGQYPA